MVGIDFKDTIVVRRSVEKGTRIIEEPLKKEGVSGLEFKNRELERLKLAGDLMIMSGKGTKRIRLSDLKETTPPLLKGLIISTRRGTALMKLK